jgi:hypothetical protein
VISSTLLRPARFPARLKWRHGAGRSSGNTGNVNALARLRKLPGCRQLGKRPRKEPRCERAMGPLDYKLALDKRDRLGLHDALPIFSRLRSEALLSPAARRKPRRRPVEATESAAEPALEVPATPGPAPEPEPPQPESPR